MKMRHVEIIAFGQTSRPSRTNILLDSNLLLWYALWLFATIRESFAAVSIHLEGSKWETYEKSCSTYSASVLFFLSEDASRFFFLFPLSGLIPPGRFLLTLISPGKKSPDVRTFHRISRKDAFWLRPLTSRVATSTNREIGKFSPRVAKNSPHVRPDKKKEKAARAVHHRVVAHPPPSPIISITRSSSYGAPNGVTTPTPPSIPHRILQVPRTAKARTKDFCYWVSSRRTVTWRTEGKSTPWSPIIGQCP